MELIDLLDEQTRARVLTGFDEARERPVTLRANTLKSSIGEVCTVLEASGFTYRRVPGMPTRSFWTMCASATFGTSTSIETGMCTCRASHPCCRRC